VSSAPVSAPTAESSDIIVTGTREVGRKAQDSPTPVAIIDNKALTDTGQTNALQALAVVLPSLSTQAYGGDLSNLVRSFSLRGLAPDHTLVLINGKRRHQSAFINASGSPYTGTNPVDLALIPLSAIDHIEVLTDGAAAQYGTDAIAGVVNIILKNSDHGGTASATGGATSAGDGFQAQGAVDGGGKLGSDGFVHLSFDYDHQDHTNRSGYDPRTKPPYAVRGEITGDPAYDSEALAINLEKPINDAVTAYGFATFAHRYAESIQNYRYPGQFNSITPLVSQVYPNGFFPIETIDEYDAAATAGVKGNDLFGWAWDLSTTYGEDVDNIGTIHSINPRLLAAIGYPQSSFNDGQFTAGQLTTNLDFHRGVDTGWWSAPVNVAVGLEHRFETYHVGAGETASYVLGGAQAFPGFTPSSSSSTSRNVVAAYLDLSTHFTPQWQGDLSGRVEDYSDVGAGLTGKVSTRYDFTSWLAARGSFGNGYHAPTLAQENFAATNVSPTSASAQLPVNSIGARLLGAPQLKPETSENISFGLVAEPLPRLHATVDAYQISVDHRIIDTGILTGPASIGAIEANGNSLPAGVPTSSVGAQFFTNGVNTRTDGIDVNLDYSTDVGDFGVIKWFLNADYNYTKITKIDAAPASFRGASLLSPASISYLTSATPRDKISIGGTWYLDKWELSLRETRFDQTAEYSTTDNVHYNRVTVNAALITYLNVRYNVNEHWSVDVGANNLFAVEPNKTPLISRGSTNAGVYAGFSPYGIDGGYYFARLTAHF
jgi:iron complex outermembrane receptor protein